MGSFYSLILIHLASWLPSFSPDIFSSVSVLPSLKVCLDLSAEYLILSDVQRKVDCSGGTLGSAGIVREGRGVWHIHSPLSL